MCLLCQLLVPLSLLISIFYPSFNFWQIISNWICITALLHIWLPFMYQRTCNFIRHLAASFVCFCINVKLEYTQWKEYNRAYFICLGFWLPFLILKCWMLSLIVVIYRFWIHNVWSYTSSLKLSEITVCLMRLSVHSGFVPVVCFAIRLTKKKKLQALCQVCMYVFISSITESILRNTFYVTEKNEKSHEKYMQLMFETLSIATLA